MSLRRFFLTCAVIVPVAWIGVGLAISRSHPAFAQPGTARVVYLGLSKNLAGEGNTRQLDQYRCVETGKALGMQVVSTTLHLQVSSNSPCDEITNAGALDLQWRIVLRADQGGFGTHNGTFTWKDVRGNLATGTMVGTIGCGTHRPPNLEQCEVCRVPQHFEGLLTGKFTAGPLFVRSHGTAQVQATYAGQLNGQMPVFNGAKGSLDGVYILPCQQAP